MPRDERFISLALKIARKSQHTFPMCAIITQGNRVMSVGINKCKTNPRQNNVYPRGFATSTHAELDAIISSCSNNRGATIYIARMLHNGKGGMAKPCKICQRIIEMAEIKRVVFTTNEGFEMYENSL